MWIGAKLDFLYMSIYVHAEHSVCLRTNFFTFGIFRQDYQKPRCPVSVCPSYVRHLALHCFWPGRRSSIYPLSRTLVMRGCPASDQRGQLRPLRLILICILPLLAHTHATLTRMQIWLQIQHCQSPTKLCNSRGWKMWKCKSNATAVLYFPIAVVSFKFLASPTYVPEFVYSAV